MVTDFTVFLADQLGEEGMAQLRDLNPVFYDTAVPAQQGLAAGEVAITLYATAQLQDDAAAGAPVEFVVPTPAWSPPVLSYILGWAKHPNAAQLVLDYMATPAGQEAIAINGASALGRDPRHAGGHRRRPTGRDRSRHRRVGGAVPGRVGGVLRSVTGR